MKIFLFVFVFATLIPWVDANAAYYWERTRNTYKADGSILMVDPSSPQAVVANNYETLADYYGYKERPASAAVKSGYGIVSDNVIPEECLRDGDVLAVSHTMPANTLLQNSSPVYIGQPKVIAYPMTKVETQPLMTGLDPHATSATMSNDMMPPSYAGSSYDAVTVPYPAGDTVTSYPAPAPVTYTTDVSPGYGYADSMAPLN